MLLALLQIVAAWWLADLLSGVYHWLTDHGCNIRWQVEMFRWHHADPQAMRADWYAAAVGVPLCGLSLLWPSLAPFWVTLGGLLTCTQLIHYLAHHPEHAGPLRWLQRAGVILSPDQHAEHHQGAHDRRYCVVSGANNWWLDWLLPRR